MKQALQNITLVLLSCLVTLAAFETGLRIWMPEPDYYRLYQFDPILGWVNRPHARIDFVRDEFRYPVEINSFGMWDEELTQKRNGEFRVAFLGDSFTWGWGAAYGERFTEVIEAQNHKINALNFGVPGYGPVQYMLQLEQDLSLQPDYVIVAFCLGNDLTDNLVSDLDEPKPYARLSDDTRLEIIGYPLPTPDEDGTRGKFTPRILDLIERAFDRLSAGNASTEEERVPYEIFYAPNDALSAEQRQLAAKLYRVNDAIFEAMRDRIKAAIGPDRFAVLLAPSKYEQGQFLERWQGANPNAVAEKMLDSLARLKIPALDGRKVIERNDFWHHDGHWRPSGHRKIGNMLAEFMSKIVDEYGMERTGK